jgi:hypothetical protein
VGLVEVLLVVGLRECSASPPAPAIEFSVAQAIPQITPDLIHESKIEIG